MDELTLDNKKYLSSKRAAQVTGYAKDYVGQLSREGRVEARLVGRNWYVLENSILEHRFGPEEAKNDPISAPLSPTSSWAAPVYAAEPVQIVPEMAPKQAPQAITEPPALVEAPKHALDDMQSAWKEWFDAQKRQEAALPDASEMLLEESYADAPVQSLPEPEFEPVAIEKREAPIHIERIAATSLPIEEPVHAVAVRREYAPQPVQVQMARQRASATKPVQPARATRKGSLMLRAFLIAVSGLAVVVSVIGSGLADQYLQGNSASSITDFVGGVNKISK